ncbi:hypothetical protein INT43_002354 [Umbelopsis isabellina]|uniref:Uncharacterized protein n=1 Tax=Mortierella isabellina TaxID=91625 RepID=A0A8H7UHE6_MORIS|nr:hypothetical protein INT43_002354 [Umbelopsis isabellina]
MKGNTSHVQIPVELLYEIFYQLSKTYNNDLDGFMAIMNASFVNRSWLYVAYRFLNNHNTARLAQLLNWSSSRREYTHRSKVTRFVTLLKLVGISETIDIPEFTLDFHPILNNDHRAATDIRNLLSHCKIHRLKILFDANFDRSKGRIKLFLAKIHMVSSPSIVHFAAYCPQRRCQCCCAKGYDKEIAEFVQSLKVTTLVMQQMQPGICTLAALKTTRELVLDRCLDSSFISRLIQQMPLVKSVRLYQDDLSCLSTRSLTRLATSIGFVKDFRIQITDYRADDGSDLYKKQQQISNMTINSELISHLDDLKLLQQTGFSICGNELILSNPEVHCAT